VEQHIRDIGAVRQKAYFIDQEDAECVYAGSASASSPARKAQEGPDLRRRGARVTGEMIRLSINLTRSDLMTEQPRHRQSPAESSRLLVLCLDIEGALRQMNFQNHVARRVRRDPQVSAAIADESHQHP
jgi:hypothetical protein